MTVEITPNGILISDIIGSRRIKKLYIGYTVKESKQLFKKEFNSIK